MDYFPALGEKLSHSRGNVGKYSLHGASGLPFPQLHDLCEFSLSTFPVIPCDRKKTP